jgi:hypothetical protein
VFAARATASFPGAFPPFRIGELDAALAERGRPWPGRQSFTAAALPRQSAIGDVESAVLIDGSVLANAPFRPAIAALRSRPARREIDRRFVYIDPKPGSHAVRLAEGGGELPGFFGTIFGALSDIPREQPIRDSLEALDGRSKRIRRMTRIVEAMQPQVERAIERAFGSTLLLLRPTPSRLAAWRAKAHTVAARESGFAYAAYGHLKLAIVVEDVAEALSRASNGREGTRKRLWEHVRARGLVGPEAIGQAGGTADVIAFLRSFDIGFRVRRLRFVSRRLAEMEQSADCPATAAARAQTSLYELIDRYEDCAERVAPEAGDVEARLAAFAAALDLSAIDDEADAALAEVLALFPKPARRSLILAYLGFAFYDVATLPLLQGEGLDEFHPVKVDRISPEDATSIRKGGAAATLKGTQLNSFGAFFSRAYRENDYLWGRLHGADRLIEITVSALPKGTHLPPGLVASLKRAAFRAILTEERPRLTAIQPLFDALDGEVGPASPVAPPAAAP